MPTNKSKVSPKRRAKTPTGLVLAPKGADLSYIMPSLRDGLVVKKSCLHLDPKNPRRGNVEMVAFSLSMFGQQKTPIIYKFPGDEFYTVIAGNHTTRASDFEVPEKDSKGEPFKFPTPWEYLAVTEFIGTPEEAQAFALMDNRSSDVATYDDEVLAKLLKQTRESSKKGLVETTGYSDQDLTYLLSRIELEEEEEDETFEIESTEIDDDYVPEYIKLSEAQGDNTGELVSGSALPENYWEIKFSSTNKYEVPDLLSNMLGDPPPQPVQTWPGEKYADDDFNGTWFVNWGYPSRGVDFTKSVIGFYTDDDTLMSLWNNPARFTQNFLKLNPLSVIAPGFSIWMADPFPKRIWGYYTMQFLARYYQESGIKVIPDAPVPVPKRDYNWFVDGIPRNAPCIAMQFQTGVTKSDKEAIGWYISSINKAIELLKPQSLLLYASKLGHTVTWNMFPSSLNVIRVATVQDVRRFRYLPDPLSSLVDSYDPKYTGKKKALKNQKLLEKEKKIEAEKTKSRIARRKNI